MPQPLISVVVPIYNVEPYLDRCVSSIAAQSYENLEIILVDDGSPDGCPSICDAWEKRDSRIKVIHKENGGLSDARNAGMAIASGEYICFIDSDDWVALDYVQELYQSMMLTDAQIAACDVVVVKNNQEIRVINKEPSLRICGPEEAIHDIISGEGFRAVVWNKLFRRDLLEQECFEVGKHHEDEFFTYRILAKAVTLVYTDKPLYYYVQREGSIMSCTSIKRLDALDAYLERLSFLEVRYPSLYREDKYNFCRSCVAFYLLCIGRDEPAMKNKIKACRRQVSFTVKEFMISTNRQRLYILGSRFCIGLFCRLLGYRNRGL